MKTLVFFVIVAATLPSFGSTDTIQPKSTISHVTLFFSGAQVTRKADLKLKKGKCILLIEPLPQEIVPNSIQVTVPAHYKILAVKQFQHQQNPNLKSKEELLLNDQVEALENKIKGLSNEVIVLDMEERILMDKSVTEKTARDFTVLQLKEIADFYRARLNEIRRNKLTLAGEMKTLDEEKGKLYEKINELTVNKRKVVSQLFITVDCTNELPAELKISYYVSSAGWEPLYDFRVDDIEKPFVIVYNANVFQSSGEDWKNVNVKLSTTNPSLSGERQKLSAWYIGRPYQQLKPGTNNLSAAIKGYLSDSRTKEPIAFAAVSVFQNGQMIATASSNMDGEFYVKPINPGYCEIKAYCVGYQLGQMNGISVESGKTAYVNLELGSNSVKLAEVELQSHQTPLIDPDTKSGQSITREDYQNLATKDVNSLAATSAGVYRDEYMRGGRGNNGMEDADELQTIETLYLGSEAHSPAKSNMEYVIDEPCTIPCDGSDYTIRIKEQSLNVNYMYYAVPKLEQEVFLSAQISDWSALNLISGKFSVYYQETYVGQSFLDVAQTGDTLSVSLGRDKDVQINREPTKMLSVNRGSGNTIKEINGTNMVIRNNKNSRIKILVEDQYPLSERKSVEIELLDAANAAVNERLGKLTWELNLEPAEKKLLTYSYSLRYPKWAKIINE